jgi:hypothetical protein
MLQLLILFTSAILTGWEYPKSITSENNIDIERYVYIPISELDLYKIRSDFMTVINQDTIYFKYSLNQKSRVLYVLQNPNDTITNRIIFLANSISCYRFKNEFKVSSFPEIKSKNVNVVYFMEPTLKVKYVRNAMQGEFFYASKIIKRNEREYELLVGVEYPKTKNIFESTTVNNFIPISIILPHLNEAYIPYLWILEEEVPNILLYEYSEDKIRRLNDVFKE